MMSSILSGINVLASMILIWLKGSKIKFPDPIQKFILHRLPKILRIDSKDASKVFGVTDEFIAYWKATRSSIGFPYIDSPDGEYSNP